jgi:predicted Zn-dependent peptidase
MIKTKNERFNETVYILKLKNQMEVHILPKEDPYYTTYVELSVPYGAINLSFKKNQTIINTPAGTAHFFEHKIFAMPDGDAFSRFSMLGADANAMTSYEQTSYLFVTTESVIPALSHLLHMIDTPYFTDENVNAEKKIIAEELKMYLDDPNVMMQNRLMENMYHNHPIKYDIGGTLSSIEEITKETLLTVHETLYQHKNRLLVIAGKVNLDEIESFLKSYDQLSIRSSFPFKNVIPKEPKHVVKKYETIKNDHSIDRLMIGIKLKPRKQTPKEQVKRELCLSMVLNMVLGQSSMMYQSLLSEKLINQSFYVSTNFEKEAENIIIFSETKKVNQLKKRLIDLLTNHLKDEITFEAFKRYQKVYLGQFIYALNHLETKANLYAKYKHLGISLFDVVDLIHDVKEEDIEIVTQEIQKRYMSILIYKKA